MAPVASVYESDVYKGNNYQVRDLDESLVRILEHIMVHLPGPFYVVIDGLDETAAAYRPRLLDLLRRLWQSTVLNLLLTSRPETNVKEAFRLDSGVKGFSELSISESAVHWDIYCYVKWQLEYDPNLCKIKSQGLKADMERTLIERSGGM